MGLKVIALGIVIVGTLSSCLSDQRLPVLKAEQSLRSIRAAEQRTLSANHRFATLSELAQSGEIQKSLSDGYRFELILTSSGYRVIASPTPLVSEREPISFFMDETGVIRASISPDVVPSTKSDPIAEQW